MKSNLINFESIVKKEIKSLKNILSKKLSDAKQRCVNPKASGFKSYGGRGIKVDCNLGELIAIWIRDDGYSLQQASIDRIDNNGNYILNNIHFIEAVDNTRKSKKVIDINVIIPDLINLEFRLFNYVEQYLSPMKFEIDKNNLSVIRTNYKLKLIQQFKNLMQYQDKTEEELEIIVEQCLIRKEQS